MNIISDKKIKSSRKEYYCDACILINEMFGSFESFIKEVETQITDNEINALRNAEHQEFKILKGDSYRKVFFVDDNNDSCTFRGLLDIEKICHNYDIYEEQ